METYIVFLRGVNVSGKNLIKMADLKQYLSSGGFEKAATYIQSGNIVVQSNLKKTEAEKNIRAIILKHFEFSIPVFVLTVDEVVQALKNNPFPKDAEPNKVFFTFLEAVPDATLINKLSEIDFGTEVFKIIDKLLYFYVPEGMGKSKMNNNFFEKKLKVTATGRNLNTVRKMLELTQK
ncbi:MAG TPA: DUF1697 domain-containing protein [Flavobacterium sp.]|nr:DUF1697 domain-containing protein [Flavobacterium sp.]